MRRSTPHVLLRALIPFLLVLGTTGCRENETAIARGDRLWADSSYESALAEYQLAAAQRDDEAALSRLAHAMAYTGRLNEARETYQSLLERSPDHADQAAWDFLGLARRALRRGAEADAALALDAAFSLRPELQAPHEALAVAGFYRQLGELDRSAAYFHRALAGLPTDSSPPVLYELGVLEEERGRCDVAIDYFRSFREVAEDQGPRWRSLVGEARWHTGNCALRLAREAREDGRVSEALEHLATVLRLGEPENLLDQAWFDRGELLYGVGDFEEALEAYRMVLERNPARTGQLVERAQRRIDEIRFGDRPAEGVETEGRIRV